MMQLKIHLKFWHKIYTPINILYYSDICQTLDYGSAPGSLQRPGQDCIDDWQLPMLQVSHSL